MQLWLYVCVCVLDKARVIFAKRDDMHTFIMHKNFLIVHHEYILLFMHVDYYFFCFHCWHWYQHTCVYALFLSLVDHYLPKVLVLYNATHKEIHSIAAVSIH